MELKEQLQIASDNQGTLIIALAGLFYVSYEESAYVLSQVTEYKVIKTSEKAKARCGFPKSEIENIKNLLEKNYVNYQLYENKEIVFSRKEEINNYFSYLKNFDESKIIIKKRCDKLIQPEDPAIIESKGIRYSFICPKKIADRLDTVWADYSECYGDESASKDLFLTQLLSIGIKQYEKINAD